MGAALSLCIVDDSWEPEEVFIQKILRRYLDSGEAKLALAPVLATQGRVGAGRTLFQPGERILEIWVETLQVAKSWAPLKWRFATAAPIAALAAAAKDGRQAAAAKGGPSQRFWRAKVVAGLPNGEERSVWCLLQVATAPEDRTTEAAMLDRQDAERVALYAQSFNQMMMRDEAGADSADADGAPRVQVCLPTVCKVLQSPVPQYFARGDSVLLHPYYANEVSKFVFDGHEDFLETPQAFFHYVTWSSGGRECVCDLQGNEEDNGSFTLVNTCIPRPPALGAGSLFGGERQAPAQVGPGAWTSNPSPQMFDRIHPRCGPLCRTFDPERRAKPLRKHCGMPMSCGLNQSTCDARDAQERLTLQARALQAQALAQAQGQGQPRAVL